MAYAGHFKAGEREPRKVEDIAPQYVERDRKTILARLAWQKEQWERFCRAGARARGKERERDRRQLIETTAAEARPWIGGR